MLCHRSRHHDVWNLRYLPLPHDACDLVVEHMAAMCIQRAWRIYRVHKICRWERWQTLKAFVRNVGRHHHDALWNLLLSETFI
jgi:hypothetical protein